MNFTIYIFGTLILVFNLLSAQAAAQKTATTQENVEEASIEKAVDVKIVFQNTTNEEINFQILATSDDDGNTAVEGVPIHEGKPLPRNFERTYASKSGMVWEILSKRKKIIGQYVADESPRQTVDIKGLISWQSQVKVNFQNNTKKPVSFYWTSPEGKQILIIENMPAGTELKNNPLVCMPNQLWTIKQGNNFFANYIPDNKAEQVVDLRDLKTWFQPVEITFHNATNTKLDIYVIDSDGNEVKYTGDQPLVNSKLIQPANPLTMWLVKSGDEVVAEYVTTNQKKQECKITDAFLNSPD